MLFVCAGLWSDDLWNFVFRAQLNILAKQTAKVFEPGRCLSFFLPLVTWSCTFRSGSIWEWRSMSKQCTFACQWQCQEWQTQFTVLSSGLYCINSGLCITKKCNNNNSVTNPLMSVPLEPESSAICTMTHLTIISRHFEAVFESVPPQPLPGIPGLLLHWHSLPAGVYLQDENWTKLLQYPNPPLSLHYHIL